MPCSYKRNSSKDPTVHVRKRLLRAMGVQVLNSRPTEKEVDVQTLKLRSAEAAGLDLKQFNTIQARPEVGRCGPSIQLMKMSDLNFGSQFGRKVGWVGVTCAGVPRVQEDVT